MIHCAAIFTDHMLLQRGKPIAVFGTGTAGEPVTVSVPQRHCTVSSAVRQDGTWRVTLPPMPAGTGCTLTVNEQEFSDVAFGEVWLAGGQSNMEFMLKDARNGTAELEQCRNSNVRYFQVPRNTFADDAYTAAWNAARWELPDPETSGTMVCGGVSGGEGTGTDTGRSCGNYRLQLRRLIGQLLAAGIRSAGTRCRSPLFAGLRRCRCRKDGRGNDRRV